jgi:hypothetical protein
MDEENHALVAEAARVDLTKFLKYTNGLHHYVPLIALIKKHIWFA